EDAVADQLEGRQVADVAHLIAEPGADGELLLQPRLRQEPRARQHFEAFQARTSTHVRLRALADPLTEDAVRLGADLESLAAAVGLLSRRLLQEGALLGVLAVDSARPVVGDRAVVRARVTAPQAELE